MEDGVTPDQLKLKEAELSYANHRLLLLRINRDEINAQIEGLRARINALTEEITEHARQAIKARIQEDFRPGTPQVTPGHPTETEDLRMTPRQTLALAAPISDPDTTDITQYRAARTHATGLLLMTILAVDR